MPLACDCIRRGCGFQPYSFGSLELGASLTLARQLLFAYDIAANHSESWTPKPCSTLFLLLVF